MRLKSSLAYQLQRKGEIMMRTPHYVLRKPKVEKDKETGIIWVEGKDYFMYPTLDGNLTEEDYEPVELTEEDQKRYEEEAIEEETLIIDEMIRKVQNRWGRIWANWMLENEREKLIDYIVEGSLEQRMKSVGEMASDQIMELTEQMNKNIQEKEWLPKYQHMEQNGRIVEETVIHETLMALH